MRSNVLRTVLLVGWVSVGISWYWANRTHQIYTNRINVSELSSEIRNQFVIPLRDPEEFDGRSIADIMTERRKALEDSGIPVSGRYQPSPHLFGFLADGKPWWGTTGLYFSQAKGGPTEGPSRESIALLNPLLLLSLHDLSAIAAPDDRLQGVTQPDRIFPRPISLVYDARANEFTATFDVSMLVKYLTESDDPNKPFEWGFTLSNVNARDFGFTHVRLDTSHGMDFFQFNDKVQLQEVLGVGTSCRRREDVTM